MRQKSMDTRGSAEQTVRAIRRKTRKQYSAEEKIRIVLAGLRGEDSISELCRREGIAGESVLQLVEGVFGGRQEAAFGRYRPVSVFKQMGQMFGLAKGVFCSSFSCYAACR